MFFGKHGKHAATPLCSITWGYCDVATNDETNRDPRGKVKGDKPHRCMDELPIHDKVHHCMFCDAVQA